LGAFYILSDLVYLSSSLFIISLFNSALPRRRRIDFTSNGSNSDNWQTHSGTDLFALDSQGNYILGTPNLASSSPPPPPKIKVLMKIVRMKT